MSNFRNKSVDVHQFSMIPSADIPRSRFNAQSALKTTFDAGYLVPIYCDEVLPGDTFNTSCTLFGRLATPLFPIMDNLHMDTFFFFVPNRLIWDNWRQFMGQQDKPGDSTDYLVPQLVSPTGGFAVNSLYDYMGLPTVGQVNAESTVSVCAFWPRAYALIWNEWFRDENLQDPIDFDTGDGPDNFSTFTLKRRGKRKDYFTGALPWPQKGEPVNLPLGGIAPVHQSAFPTPAFTSDPNNPSANYGFRYTAESGYTNSSGAPRSGDVLTLNLSNFGLYADLSQATAATVNQIRQSFQIQKLLERDARGGTRYTELVRSHFGVVSPDARQQRPEYIGGGSVPININPIAQTSATTNQGGDTPLGNLAAMGTMLAHRHGFTYSATEHGVILGLVSIRADLTYQQGLHRMWSRRSRYDFFFPVFSHLGEQAILNKEIYATGTASDENVFGYQERWAEYRYKPSMITGLFKSTSAGTVDAWHLAQRFNNLPTLSSDFIEDRPPVDRITAVGDAANGQQFLLDCFFNTTMARPMPMYSTPGLIDHF